MDNRIIPFKPYLLQAAYDWLIDNNLTTYVKVDTSHPEVIVPSKYIEEGSIVLDVTPRAIHHLKINDEVLEFEARFGSKVCFISVPIQAIQAIYSCEYGCGVRFLPEDDANFPTSALIIPPPKALLSSVSQSPSSAVPKAGWAGRRGAPSSTKKTLLQTMTSAKKDAAAKSKYTSSAKAKILAPLAIIKAQTSKISSDSKASRDAKITKTTKDSSRKIKVAISPKLTLIRSKKNAAQEENEATTDDGGE